MSDLTTRSKKSEVQQNIKSIEMEAVRKKMGVFTELIKQRRQEGFHKKIFQDGNEVAEAVEEYLDQIIKIGLVPDVSGFCLYWGIRTQTFYAMLNCGDDRAAACQSFKEYLDLYTAQSGLAQSTNPAFACFFAKSRLGWCENDTLNVNVNVGAQQQISFIDLMALVENTPIEADYTDVTEELQ